MKHKSFVPNKASGGREVPARGVSPMPPNAVKPPPPPKKTRESSLADAEGCSKSLPQGEHFLSRLNLSLGLAH